MEDLGRLIRAHPFFADLAPDHLQLVVGCAANRRLTAGQMLFQEGAPADHFFLLREGRVALELNVPQRGPFVFETIDEDEVLGWSWLLPPYRWHFDARAVTNLRYFAFDAKCLRGKMEADHELGYVLMQHFLPVIVDRLQATRVRMLDLFGAGRGAEPGHG